MTPWPYAVTPGEALAICGPKLGALVVSPLPDSVQAGLLEVIAGGEAGLDEALEVLISPGLRAIADFGLMAGAEGGHRVVVRGRVGVCLGAEAPVSAQGLWLDRTAPAGVPVRLVLDGAEAEPIFPLGAGMVPAGSLGIALGESAAPAVAAPAAVPADEAAAAADQPEAPAASIVEAVGTASTAREEPPIAASASGASAAPLDVAAPQDDGGVPGDPQYDHLFGRTISAPPELPEAAEPELAPEPDVAGLPPMPSGHTLPQLIVPPMAVAAAAPAVEPLPDGPVEMPAASAAFIDSIPWVVAEPRPLDGRTMEPQRPSAPPSPSRPPVAPVDLTVDRSALRAGDQSGYFVAAVRCPRGHLNPTHASVCRVCADALPPQQPIQAPRPALGVLRFSNGDLVVLDRGCILGRNPRIPSGYSGEQPNLVRLNDPDKDISSQHLQIDLDGWHVLVKDLGSTNGTEVNRPGESPTSVRPNDPLTIEPGTQVVLAGVLSFTYEVTE